jgi:hypothetical protein
MNSSECLLEISEDPICQSVVKKCEDITRSKISCETAILEFDSSSSDKELKCMWLDIVGDGYCVSDDIGCYMLSNISSCFSNVNCDVFAGNICKRRIFYNGSCSLLGKDICFSTSGCKWDEDDGCVSEEEKSSSSSLSWELIVFISLTCVNMICICTVLYIIFYIFFLLLFSNNSICGAISGDINYNSFESCKKKKSGRGGENNRIRRCCKNRKGGRIGRRGDKKK